MSLQSDLLGEIEVHSPGGIQSLLAAGVSAVEPIHGLTPMEHLTSGYLRSDRFAECVRALEGRGGSIPDESVRAVLLDDAEALSQSISRNGEIVSKQIAMRSAFTSCEGVTLLHLAAEFNSVRCATLLLDNSADIDARAAVDANGFGAHTPVFHAVNSIRNYCRPVMELLVHRGASLEVLLRGVVWGRDMDWETTVLDVTPISYAQCGAFRQFHRNEQDTHENLSFLFQHRYNAALVVRNVPNKYLSQ